MHVAIILDGNRRYAKKIGIDILKGHEHGARKIIELLGWLEELGAKEATLYCLSTENLKRSPVEVAALMMLFRKAIIDSLKDERIHKNKIRIRFIGKLELLPKDLQKSMSELMEATKRYDKYKVNFAVAYGSHEEITSAAKKIAEDVKNGKITPESITEEKFSEYLYLSDEPDLLIRPGGEKRISNFILWQLSYAELIFLDKLWPEITKQDIIDCILEFKTKERRKGK